MAGSDNCPRKVGAVSFLSAISYVKLFRGERSTGPLRMEVAGKVMLTKALAKEAASLQLTQDWLESVVTSGESRGGSWDSMEPCFGLNLVLRSIGDMLNGTLPWLENTLACLKS